LRRQRFLAHRDEVLRLYDQRFVRMWEFYLAYSEMAFRESDMVVFQLQMAKGIAPATRDYIAREEARLRAPKPGYTSPLRLAGEWSGACRRRKAAVKSGPRTINGRLRRAVSSGESRKQGFPRRRRSTNDRVCVVACGVCGTVPLSLSDPRC
jgi:hypothetical protein